MWGQYGWRVSQEMSLLVNLMPVLSQPNAESAEEAENAEKTPAVADKERTAPSSG